MVASCRSTKLVAETLGRLLPQCRQVGAELILARSIPAGRPDDTGAFDGCKVVYCPAGATLPEIRGGGIAAATGEWVALTEDNCVARPDWLKRLTSAFGTGVDIVGGTMGNAHPGRTIDAAAFFAEYGFFGPTRPAPRLGRPLLITGANVAYRRSVAGEVAEWASAGHWEGVIHDRLVARGARFAFVSDAVVEQNLHYRFGPFCRDRFQHGHDYARVRSGGLGRANCLARAVATPLLPPVLIWRVWWSAGRANPQGFLKALPFAFGFFAAWAAGEAVGYLRGSPS